MERGQQHREQITPEKAAQLLRENGLEVTIEQAAEILQLLRILAQIEVDNYLRR